MELFQEISTQESEQVIVQASITQVAAQGSGKQLQKALKPLELAVKRARRRKVETEQSKSDDLRRFMRDHHLGRLSN